MELTTFEEVVQTLKRASGQDAGGNCNASCDAKLGKVEESQDREPDSETTTPLTLSHPHAMFTSSVSECCLAEAEKAQRLPEAV